MRVLFDHQVFSLQNVGGATRYFYELMRYMATAPNVEAELFLGLNRPAYPFHELPADRGKVRRFPVSMGPGLWSYAVNEALELGFAPFTGRFDIYHPTYFRCLPTVRARRIVITNHDCTYEQFPHLFRDAALVIRSRRTLLAKADKIICSSEDSRRTLLKFHSVDPGQTCVVHLGLNHLPRLPQAARELRSRTRRKFLLYVGVRNFHKNFGALLQAYNESRLYEEYDLLALGGGPLSRDESKTIASMGLTGAVICFPSVDEHLLAEAYASAALFVYPSLAEGFGMPPLEAMAAGCPVAASNVSAIPEVCQDAPFYFDPYDIDSIASALLKGVTESDDRSCAIAKGKRVAARYSWQKCGEMTLAAYRGCQ